MLPVQPSLPHRLKPLLALSVLVLMLAGCQTSVTTQMKVTSAHQAEVTAVLELRDEAAEAVHRSPELSTRLQNLFRAKAGDVSVKDSASSIRFSALLNPDKLAETGSLTGVNALEISDSGSKDVTAKVTMVSPTDLLVAIRGYEDKAAVTPMLENTTIAIEVTFPGGVSKATGPAVTTSGPTARSAQPLSDFAPGVMEVSGNPEAPSNYTSVVLVALVLVGLFAGAWLLRRRNRS